MKMRNSACGKTISNAPVKRTGRFVEMTDASLPLVDTIVVEPDGTRRQLRRKG